MNRRSRGVKPFNAGRGFRARKADPGVAGGTPKKSFIIKKIWLILTPLGQDSEHRPNVTAASQRDCPDGFATYSIPTT